MRKQTPVKHLIGLTGSIASGKSTVLSCFEKLGAQTLSADKLVRELYQKPQVRKRLEEWFGSADRAKVAKAVFSSAMARRKVEQFLHPLVWRLAQEKLAGCTKPWAIFEVPLLFEKSWDERMDMTLLVVADPKTLPARLKERGFSLAAYERRRQIQLPEEEKIRRADVVIYNRGSKQALNAKIKDLYQALNTFYA